MLTEVLQELGVPEEKHAATCVLVDKLDKVRVERVGIGLSTFAFCFFVLSLVYSIVGKTAYLIGGGLTKTTTLVPGTVYLRDPFRFSLFSKTKFTGGGRVLTIPVFPKTIFEGQGETLYGSTI